MTGAAFQERRKYPRRRQLQRVWRRLQIFGYLIFLLLSITSTIYIFRGLLRDGTSALEFGFRSSKFASTRDVEQMSENGLLHCMKNNELVDRSWIAYWKDVPSDYSGHPELLAEENLVSEVKYVTFEPDFGGWNNISLTGRVLVMPPVQPLYLLNKGKHITIEEFFTPKLTSNPNRLKTISSMDFFRTEADYGGLKIDPGKDFSSMSHREVYTYYEAVARQYNNAFPVLKPAQTAILFPLEANNASKLSDDPKYSDNKELVDWIDGRDLFEYGKMKDAKVIHWNPRQTRLLTHFYTFIRHSNSSVDRYHKRLVRDLLHYNDEVFCTAADIVAQIHNQYGSFSSFHIRRGEFQFKDAVNIPISDMIEAANEYLLPSETLFIATDEKDKSVFVPFELNHKVLFLSDFWKSAGLDKISNQNFIGMVDSIVAAEGRTFTGTWWSTFTGYIVRLRGYRGKPRDSAWYTYEPKRTFLHTYESPVKPYWMTEWDPCWEGIDEL